jgi:ABC-type transport system involved in multi-copper enzyme maturation permease subunit
MMITNQKAIAVEKTESTRRLNPLLAVVSWELRRLRANRLNWVIAIAALLFFMGMIELKHVWLVPLKDGESTRITIIGASAFGLLFEFINVLLLFFGMFLPFVVTEAVARDAKQRTHELLMATPIPTWAFVWGRFVATFIVSLALAFVLLVAVALMSENFYLTQPGYPAPNFIALGIVWTLIVLPATVLLNGISFALGTISPRLAVPMKLAALIGWIVLFIQGDFIKDRLGQWLWYWNPTSAGVLQVLLPQFIQNLLNSFKGTPTNAQLEQLAFQLQQQLPNLTPWVLPYLGLVAIGLALVAVASMRFERFRNVMN